MQALAEETLNVSLMLPLLLIGFLFPSDGTMQNLNPIFQEAESSYQLRGG